MSCYVPLGAKGQLKLLSLKESTSHLLGFISLAEPIEPMQQVYLAKSVSFYYSGPPFQPNGRAYASRAADLGSIPSFAVDLGPSHTGDFKMAAPIATLPDAWRLRVGAGTGRPGVSIL